MSKSVNEMTDDELNYFYQLITDEKKERKLLKAEKFINEFKKAFYALEDNGIELCMYDEEGIKEKIKFSDFLFGY